MGKKTLSILLVLIAVLALPCIVVAKDFKDVSSAAGVADDGLGKGVAFSDIKMTVWSICTSPTKVALTSST